MTYLMACETQIGTRQVIASDETEAMDVGRQYLAPGDWRIVGHVAPDTSYTRPVFHPDLIGQRDPLEGDE